MTRVHSPLPAAQRDPRTLTPAALFLLGELDVLHGIEELEVPPPGHLHLIDDHRLLYVHVVRLRWLLRHHRLLRHHGLLRHRRRRTVGRWLLDGDVIRSGCGLWLIVALMVRIVLEGIASTHVI